MARVRLPAGLAAMLALAILALSAQSIGPTSAEETPALPAVSGPVAPRVEPVKGEDGIYRQRWYEETFLDLKEDFTAARAAGKRFAVIFEQRGCIYCTKMHTEVLAQKYINDYVRENFRIVQIDLWGSREVTDFDGTKMPEKKLAERWGVLFTPTVVFYKHDLADLAGQWGQPLEVARMGLGIGAATFYDMFSWIGARMYEKDRNFQRFHLARMAERQAGKDATGQKP